MVITKFIIPQNGGNEMRSGYVQYVQPIKPNLPAHTTFMAIYDHEQTVLEVHAHIYCIIILQYIKNYTMVMEVLKKLKIQQFQGFYPIPFLCTQCLSVQKLVFLVPYSKSIKNRFPRTIVNQEINCRYQIAFRKYQKIILPCINRTLCSNLI